MALNLAPIIPAIFTGPNGEALSPEQIRDRQLIAQSLMGQATDTSPNAGGWASILAKGVQGFQAGRERRGADDAISGNNTYNSDLLNSLLNGSSTSAASSPMASAATSGVAQEMAATSPAPNVSPEIASGIVETANALGIDPVDLGTAISYETAGTFDPTKAGPTTQWGQHKGLIQFGEPQAKQYGVDWNNPVGSQLGANGAVANYLRSTGVKPGMGMMDVYSAINAGRVGRYGASDANNGGAPGTVADKVNQQMAGHRAKAMALLGTQRQPAQAAIEQVAPSGYVDPMVSVQPQAVQQSGFDGGRFGDAAPQMADSSPEIYSAQTDFAPELPAPVNVASAPAVAAVQQPTPQPAQLPQSPSANTAIIAQALRVMGDPRANDGTRRVAQALLQQEQQKQQFAQEQNVWQQRQQYEQQQQNSDPLRQLQIQKAQQELAGGSRQSLVNAGDGRIYDPNSQQWITAPDAASRNFRQATPDEVKAFGTNGQVGPDGKFYPITPPQGTALSVDPTTGAVTFNQGAGVKPLTEAQSKDSFFTTRMTAATPTIDKFEGALMSLPEAAAGAIPMNLGRYAQSEEYQLAKDAGRDFVNAYLRKDSGAALTAQEEANYGQLLLPQPGDKPAILAAKRQRRQIATEAIKSGMPPSAVDGMLKAIQAVPGADKPAETTSEKKTRTGVQWSID